MTASFVQQDFCVKVHHRSNAYMNTLTAARQLLVVLPLAPAIPAQTAWLPHSGVSELYSLTQAPAIKASALARARAQQPSY